MFQVCQETGFKEKLKDLNRFLDKAKLKLSKKTHIVFFLISSHPVSFFVFLAVLGIKPRVLRIRGKYLTTEIHPQPDCFLFLLFLSLFMKMTRQINQ